MYLQRSFHRLNMNYKEEKHKKYPTTYNNCVIRTRMVGLCSPALLTNYCLQNKLEQVFQNYTLWLAYNLFLECMSCSICVSFLVCLVRTPSEFKEFCWSSPALHRQLSQWMRVVLTECSNRSNLLRLGKCDQNATLYAISCMYKKSRLLTYIVLHCLWLFTLL